MQKNLKWSHINTRFQERFGREFTQRDKREVLRLISERGVTLRKSKSHPDSLSALIIYENTPTMFIIGTDGTFITCFDANSSYNRERK